MASKISLRNNFYKTWENINSEKIAKSMIMDIYSYGETVFRF